MKSSPKHSTSNFKSTYPDKQAYNFPEGKSHGFPWLHPDYIPWKITLINILEERDFEEKEDNETEYKEDEQDEEK